MFGHGDILRKWGQLPASNAEVWTSWATIKKGARWVRFALLPMRL
jgi:hypothetical protein